MNNEQQLLIDEAYEHYCKEYENGTHLIGTGLLWMAKETKDTFVYRSKTDSKFSEKWGLTIEERALSLEERAQWLQDNTEWDLLVGNLDHDHIREVVEEEAPTKLITLSYHDKTITSCE
jgi:hypothetical protein